MRESYHNPPATQKTKTWSPGQPFDPNLQPDPPRALRRNALSEHDLRQTSPVEPCLKCGRLLVKVDHVIIIRCPEGRVVVASVCYRCAQSAEFRRAA